MSEDLQGLLEKINREGVEKARREAEEIIAAAKKKGAEIVKAASDEAEKSKAGAEKAAADYAERARATVREAARDTILSVEAAVTSLLEKLLVKAVDKVLSDPGQASAIAAQAVKEFTAKGEISCGPALAKSLAGALSSSGNFTVVTDEALGSGFSVHFDGGRVEHAFTADVVAGELAKRLRPDLAALMK